MTRDPVWEREPDSLDYTDDATGYLVAMRRGPMKHWCAYVGIPAGHPWHGLGYDTPVKAFAGAMEREFAIDDIGVIQLICGSLDAVPEENIYRLSVILRCHGGVAWAANKPASGKPDGRWWFGFDCSHSGDYVPGLSRYHADDGSEVYRDVDFVKAAASKLCADLKAGEAVAA